MLRCTFLIIIFGHSLSLLAQQQDCKTNASWVTVVFEEIKEKPDTVKIVPEKDRPLFVDKAGYTRFILTSLDSNFSILSFVISSENTDGDIEEVSNPDYYLHASAMVIYGKRKPGSSVYFTCIKAIHKNGQIFYLRPLVITP